MILIYEHLFFKREVKPRNNTELLCCIIVHYIDRKIKKIKLNALINLIIYKESLYPRKSKRNSFIEESHKNRRYSKGKNKENVNKDNKYKGRYSKDRNRNERFDDDDDE